MLSRVQWVYERPVSTVAVYTVGVLGTLLARRLLPQPWVPTSRASVPVAGLSAYLVHRMGSHTGYTKRFKHTMLDPLGGDIDDAQTWMQAIAVGGGTLGCLRMLERDAHRKRTQR